MTYEMTHRKLKKPMNNTFPPVSAKHLTGFYAALIRHCEAEIRQIGAVPLLLENAILPPKKRTGR